MRRHDADVFPVAGHAASAAAHAAYLRLMYAQQFAELFVGRVGKFDEEIELIGKYHFDHPLTIIHSVRTFCKTKWHILCRTISRRLIPAA